MSPDEFREYGRKAVDWIADYREQVESLPVLSPAEPGALRAALPLDPPERGEPFDAVLRDMDDLVLPGITHWQHPSFFAYFPGNASGPSILGDLLASGLGVQGMLWATSPAATELETHVLDWFATLLDLPEQFRSTGTGGGVIQHTASDSALVALRAALHRVSGGETERAGVAAGKYAVYCSTQTHSSVEKAVRVAGLGTDALRKIDIDPATLSMNPTLLRESVEDDVRRGVTPTLIVGTIGTTSTGAIDPIRDLGEIAREHGAWLHVDAAWAGVAAVAPEFRWINDGVELADSYDTNPHKWLLTNFDCSTFWVADRAPLIDAMSILPEYLRNTASESGDVIDYRDWHVPLGRRFRALKLWSVIRWYGAEGLREHVRNGVALAQEFAGWVEADDRFELAAPRELALVTFRLTSGDDASRALMETVNASGAMYLTHTVVDGKFALRMAIGATATEERHVRAAWELLQRSAT